MTCTTLRARRSPRLPRQREEQTNEARPRQSASSASSFPPPSTHPQIPPPSIPLLSSASNPAQSQLGFAPQEWGGGGGWSYRPTDPRQHSTADHPPTTKKPQQPGNRPKASQQGNHHSQTANKRPPSTKAPQPATIAAGRDLSQQLDSRNNRPASHQPPQKEASQTAARQQPTSATASQPSSSDNNQPAQKPASQAEAATTTKWLSRAEALTRAACEVGGRRHPTPQTNQSPNQPSIRLANHPPASTNHQTN